MEKTQKIIITDTHFGRYNNSINFLNSQLLIFDDLKRFIKMNKVDRFDLIHLGDIFESRSTISTQISDEVRLLFKELNSLIKERNPENKFIFVTVNGIEVNLSRKIATGVHLVVHIQRCVL